ncbi:MAG: chaperonin GroES [Woeseiaceae bacterium]|jgi:chaperonin GroES
MLEICAAVPIISTHRGRVLTSTGLESRISRLIINSLEEIQSMKIRPLHDRVIVKRMEEERTSPGGIVIPDAATEKPIKGEIVAVGNGKILENGEIRALDIKAGDKVLFGKYSGTEVKVDGEELLVMKEDDIMAVIEG